MEEEPGGLQGLPGGPVVKTSTSSAGGTHSIPGQGTKIPHASREKKKKTTTKQNRSNKDFKRKNIKSTKQASV